MKQPLHKTGSAIAHKERRGAGLTRRLLITGLLSCCCLQGVYAQSDVTFGWVDGFGGGDVNNDIANAVVTDAGGNTYTIGTFYGTATFGSTSFTSLSNTQDIFLVKTDAAGTVLWAKQIGGPSTDQGNAISMDAAGNIYVTGSYANAVNFGGTTLTSVLSGTTYTTDIFVAKYDGAGTLQWAKSMGGTGTEYGQYIAVNKSTGDVYYSGAFWSTSPADMDPSPSATFPLTGTSFSGDIFVSRLDNNGNFVWAKKFGGNGTDLPFGMAVDPTGDVLLSGAYATTVAFDAINLSTGSSSTFSYDGFVAKLGGAGGVVQWAKKTGSTSGSDYCRGVATDATGNVYVTGYLANAATAVDLGGNTVTGMAGSTDIMISKLSPEGLLAWNKLIGGSGADNGMALALDNSSNIYLTGTYNGTVNFNPAGSFPITSAGGTDVFISKLDNSGNFIWARSVGGADVESVYSIAVDNSGNVLTAGSYGGTANFSTVSTSTQNLSANGSGDAFVLQLMPATPTPLTLTAFTATREGAAAQLDWTTASEDQAAGFVIERSGDTRSWTPIGFVAAQSAGIRSTDRHTYHFSDKNPLTGAGFYRLKSTDLDGSFSYSDIRRLDFGNAGTFVTAYPNPVADQLSVVTGREGNVGYQLLDLTGRVVASGTLQGSNRGNTIGTQQLSAGTYLLKVISGTETTVLKIRK